VSGALFFVERLVAALLGRSTAGSSAEYIQAMQVATGTVINGKIVLEGVPLAEGAKVMVVTRGADEGFALTEQQEDALLESLDEIERGEYVTLEQLIAVLPPAR
jgi:hypothetical protein